MKVRSTFVVSSSNKKAANAAFESAGLGPDTFSGAGYGWKEIGSASYFMCSIVEEEEILNSLKETGLFEKVQTMEAGNTGG
jgi:hypothetical protein